MIYFAQKNSTLLFSLNEIIFQAFIKLRLHSQNLYLCALRFCLHLCENFSYCVLFLKNQDSNFPKNKFTKKAFSYYVGSLQFFDAVPFILRCKLNKTW